MRKIPSRIIYEKNVCERSTAIVYMNQRMRKNQSIKICELTYTKDSQHQYMRIISYEISTASAHEKSRMRTIHCNITCESFTATKSGKITHAKDSQQQDMRKNS